MAKYKKLTVTGQAHWSARGMIESDMWTWWVEVEGVTISDEEMRKYTLGKELGISFIKELQPLLPIAFHEQPMGEDKYVSAPYGIPGGTWDVNLPLSDCINPEKAEKIIHKYFPELYAMA